MARLRRGFFITFEGIEGSGKSTQLRRLAGRLSRDGVKVLSTREPGGTPAGDAIRHLLLETRIGGIKAMAELYLYLAARAQHLEDVVFPALEEGRAVLCDRFADATVAYQGYGQGLDLTLVKQLVATANLGLRPDLTVLLDLTPRVALARLDGRRVKNRLDREAISFHRRVRHGYLAQARRHASRIRIVNAARSVEAIGEDIYRLVRRTLAVRASRRRAPRRESRRHSPSRESRRRS